MTGWSNRGDCFVASLLAMTGKERLAMTGKEEPAIKKGKSFCNRNNLLLQKIFKFFKDPEM
jgi:hypothetical protein